jgi:predicted SAM-dependent methyltransferase
MKSFLNIAAGKIFPIDYELNAGNFLVQLDKMYWATNPINTIELEHGRWLKRSESEDDTSHSDVDAFEFLGNYKYQFDHISCYRFLEHITKPDVQGFIYLLSTALKIGGTLDIIVPNYETLADMILTENCNETVKHADWERHDTLLTYELLNEPSMPHASIWTPQRIKYFFGLEERFKVVSLESAYEFDGRDIYIRAIFERVK